MTIKGRNGRVVHGRQAVFVYVISILFAVFQLYFLSVGRIDATIFRGGHVAFAFLLIFLLCPATGRSRRDGFSIFDLLFGLSSIVIYIYLIDQMEELVWRAGVAPNLPDIILGVLLLYLVIEGARRWFGPILPIVTGVFLLYAFFGRYIPGIFSAASNNPKRIVSYLFSVTGVYGSAIATSATYVFLFVMYGSFLLKTGVGELFMDISKALTGRMRGGPAKVSVISSALFGSISGSATSNVVTTGTFTIPLMKSVGYKGHFAAAIETAASIGGLFLPPIMGAGGFLIAEILQVPYWEVVKAAVVPAILYYVILFALVDFEARRLDLKTLDKEDIPSFWDVMKRRGYLLVPIVVLLYTLLIMRVSAVRAGLWSILSCYLITWVRPKERMTIPQLLETLSDGSTKVLNVSAATACAGIIVGIVQMTGVGLTFSSMLMKLGSSSLFLALFTAMFVAIILGMGLPITATYITVAAIIAPALIRLGLEPIAVHLFLYFFAAVSGMTPPVCVTAFAAAGISGENPIKIGFTAVKLGMVAYILPFMFIYGPPLLLIGSAGQIIVAIFTAIIGLLGIASGLHGIAVNLKLVHYERLILATGGFFLVNVGAATNYIGFGLYGLFIIVQVLKALRHRAAAADSQNP
jgi:TRAP transporter 4TM/12TM fusion protein